MKQMSNKENLTYLKALRQMKQIEIMEKQNHKSKHVENIKKHQQQLINNVKDSFRLEQWQYLN